MIRRRVLAAMTLVAALLLAGCTSSDSLAQQYRDGSEKGYIAGPLFNEIKRRARQADNKSSGSEKEPPLADDGEEQS